MYCEKCGKNLPEGTKFCSGCGTSVEPKIGSTPPLVTGPPIPPITKASPPPPPPGRPNQQVHPQTRNNVAPPPQQAYKPSQQYTEPLSVADYIKTLLLLAIPIANIVFLFKWSFGGNTNINRKNFARASLIFAAIFIILWMLVGGFIINNLTRSMYYY